MEHLKHMKQQRNLIGLLLIALMMLAIPVFAQEDDETLNDEDTLAMLAERGVSILPLEVVTESAPVVLDIASDSARLNFIGTIPLACTILYGTTTDFGLASVDPNMDGAAIIEHNPLMLDLEPDTEYFYRVQGSAEDGTLYVGEIGSFRTLPESDEVSDNLLSPERGAEIVGVSSNFGNADNDERWGLLNAFDGNGNTAWSSNGDGDDAWFEVELDQRSIITSVEFWTRLMSDGTSQIFEFTITTDSGETFGPFEVPDASQAYEFEVEIEASSLRFDVVSSSGGNTGAMEVAVYGEPAE